MMGVEGFFAGLKESLGNLNPILVLLFFTLLIVVYSIFVFYFYKFLAKKNIIELNLKQYNKSEHPTAVKFFAVIFYIIEYIIILPVLTLFWFVVFSVFLLIMAKDLAVQTILILSASFIASVRITSYLSETLSKDLAKMIPFTLLALALTSRDFFSISLFLTRFIEIPNLFSQFPYYLLFIVSVELIMRATHLSSRLFSFSDEVDS